MGIKHFVFAINKMDLINSEKRKYEKIRKDIRVLLAEFEYKTAVMIPVSATEGDNITEKSARMPWYQGVPLLEYRRILMSRKTLRRPVLLCRCSVSAVPTAPSAVFRDRSRAAVFPSGITLTVLPSGESAAVRCIYQGSDEVQTSSSGHAVTIQLDALSQSGWRIHRSAWARCLRPVSSGWMIQSWWKGKIIC